MKFCKYCHNMLQVRMNGGVSQFYCLTCPYVFDAVEKSANKIKWSRKQVDDVLGGKEAFEGSPTTEAQCPECYHNLAFFFQLQTRSADEPMTTFLCCCQCGKRWRQD